MKYSTSAQAKQQGMMRGSVSTPLSGAFGALLLYCLFSYLLFVPGKSWANYYIGEGNDPIQFMWFLNWWPFSIGHHVNPFWSNFVWFPQGFDFAWATSVPILALLAAPITVFWNATVAFNVLSVAAPALTAWTTFLLVRSIVADSLAALVGGYIVGFSSYELGQLQGHLNLDFAVLVPLLIWVTIMRYRGSISRFWFIFIEGLLLFLQIGISDEIAATLCTLGGIVWIIFVWFADKESRKGFFRLAFDVFYSGIFSLVLSTPFLYYLIIGAHTAPAEINSVTYFSTNPLNFVVPTDVTRFGHSAAAPIAHQMSGNEAEQGAYLGLPLLLIIAFWGYEAWRERFARALIVSLIMLAILSLGPVLHVGGKPTHIRLPWLFFVHLPLIKAALPSRFSLYVSIAAAVVVGAWIARVRGRARLVRVGLACIACAFLLPNPQKYAWHKMPRMPAAVAALQAPNGSKLPNLLVLPFGSQGPDMAWQMQSGMKFTQAGGYVGFTPRFASDWSVLPALRQGTPGQNFANDFRALCARQRVDFVVLAAGTAAPLAAAIRNLAWPSKRVGDTTILRVPSPSSLSYSFISGDYWPPAPGGAFGWIGKRATVVTHNRPVRLEISGRGRPPSLAPVHVVVKRDNGSKVYVISRNNGVTLEVPANAKVSVHAERVFQPRKVIHNHDPRHLSVLVSLRPVIDKGT